MIKIKFGTDGWRAIIAQEYTVDNVARVAAGTARWMKEEGLHPSVVIGYDCRFAGKLFAETAARVFCAEGIKVYMGDNFVSTPMVSLGAYELKAGHGVVITASHNPASYNGFKLKANYGGPAIPAMVTAVEERIPESQALPAASAADYVAEGFIEYIDLEEMYLNQIKAGFDLQAIYDSNIRVAYDAMYGAGQSVFPRILPSASLLHCEFNPSFNGQAPEPLHRNLGELSALIAGNDDIKLGIANDGDADRIGMYDSSGNFVDSHHVILLLVHYLHHYKKMTGKVVIAFSVTDRVKKLCEHYGLDCEVTEIGFKHICGIMVKEDVLLGGEESGGIAIKGFIPERDGIWIGLTLLEFMAKTGRSLEELIAEVYEIVGAFVFERNDLKLDNALKLQIVENCKNNVYTSFGDYDIKRVETIDGHKFHLENEAWVMIRPSGTEPVLRVYAEAGSQAEVDAILAATKAALLG